MRNGRAKTTKIIGGMLALFGVAGLVCAGTLSTAALEQSVSKDVTVGIDPVISISVPESVTLNITPATSPELKTVSTVVTVGTNNITGYTLYMSIDNTSTNALVNQAQTSLTIPTLTGETTIINFPVNQWGYSKDKPMELATFLPLPAVGSEDKINITDAPAAASNTDVTFGTKINMSVASGAYSNVAKFTAVTNELPPEPVSACDTPIPNGPTYMQDFTSADKDKMTEEVNYKLVDKRDDKPYCVSKLKDGKVWMTQNLDYDISDAVELTPNDTNVSDNITIERSTIPKDQLSSSTWPNSPRYPYSYDPGGEEGEYIFISGSTSDDTVYPSLEACTTAGHTASECAHYSSGNLYNWTAAKATNDSNGQTSYATSSNDSICPKGWTLPSANSADPSDFGTMLNAQGIIRSTTSTSYAAGGFNKVRTTPLYWVRAGYVIDGSRGGTGGYGDYWSSTAGSSSGAYYAYFGSSYINPRYANNYRGYGYSVRCVALNENNPQPVNPDNPGGGGGTENNVNNVYNNVYKSSSTSDGTNTDAADGYTAPQGVFNSTTENQPNWFLIICLSIMSLLLLALIIYLIYRLRKEHQKTQNSPTPTA